MGKQIKSKKELLLLIDENLLNSKNKKFISKLFSISSKNYFKCFLEKNVLTFIYENDFIKCWQDIYVKNIKSPLYIDLYNVIFKQTDYKYTFNGWKQCHLIFKDGSSQYIQTKNWFNSVKNLTKKDVVDIVYNINDYYKRIVQNKDCFRELTYKENIYGRKCYLCLKDSSIFKRGMIVDTDSFYYINRKPEDCVGSHLSLYRSFESIACNLNKNTLEELKNLKISDHSCLKQTYGCQRGCRSECYAKSTNKIDKQIQDLFIKLYKELWVD